MKQDINEIEINQKPASIVKDLRKQNAESLRKRYDLTQELEINGDPEKYKAFRYELTEILEKESIISLERFKGKPRSEELLERENLRGALEAPLKGNLAIFLGKILSPEEGFQMIGRILKSGKINFECDVYFLEGLEIAFKKFLDRASPDRIESLTNSLSNIKSSNHSLFFRKESLKEKAYNIFCFLIRESRENGDIPQRLGDVLLEHF